MTDRSDIEPNGRGWRRLSYTRRCGWVDWGHALPGNPLGLKRQLEAERATWPGLSRLVVRANGQLAFAINYGQAMTGFSAERHWIVRKGLTGAARENAALGIFLSASFDLEGAQAAFPFSWVTNSGFSAEDLVSNLLGFYNAFRGYSQDRQRAICGEVSVAESLRIWDEHLPHGLGAIKNRSLRPILFPTREGSTGRGDTDFPAEFTPIRPSPNGQDWIRLKDRFIPGQLVNAGGTIDVDAAGVMTVRRTR